MTQTIESLAQKFNSHLSQLTKMIYEKNKTHKLEMVKTAVSSAIRNVPLSLIENTDEFWDYRNYVMEIRNGDKYNWSVVEKIPIPEKADVSIVSIVKEIFYNSSEDERIEAYNMLLEMLVLVANYRKLRG
jgi:hypothetical protein